MSYPIIDFKSELLYFLLDVNCYPVMAQTRFSPRKRFLTRVSTRGSSTGLTVEEDTCSVLCLIRILSPSLVSVRPLRRIGWAVVDLMRVAKVVGEATVGATMDSTGARVLGLGVLGLGVLGLGVLGVRCSGSCVLLVGSTVGSTVSSTVGATVGAKVGATVVDAVVVASIGLWPRVIGWARTLAGFLVGVSSVRVRWVVCCLTLASGAFWSVLVSVRVRSTRPNLSVSIPAEIACELTATTNANKHPNAT